MTQNLISPESQLASMSLALACLDSVQTIAIYEEMTPELLDRLKRECLTDDQSIWLDALIEKWEKWKAASVSMHRDKLKEKNNATLT